MSDEPDEPQNEAIDFGFDMRPIDTQHAISALRKYLEVLEQQMASVQASERTLMEVERPRGNDEEEQ